MKPYKTGIVVLFFSIFTQISFAQEKSDMPFLQGAPLEQRLNSYIQRVGKKIMESTCASGCFFVKFTIGKKGEVSQVSFNNGAHPAFDTLIESAIRSTSGYWIVGKGKSMAPFLLPVLYNTGLCQPIPGGGNSVTELLASMPTISDTSDVYAKSQRGMTYNFMRMTDFETPPGTFTPAPKGKPISCILLPAIHLQAPKL